MKFVRTKDYIYEPITDINSKSYNFKAKDHESYVVVSKSTITRQANTIEELCDGFWWEDSFYDNPVFIPNYLVALDKIKDWKESDRILDMDTLDRITIYGSIYVKGQGWIHVAKINDKGELELL